jgi:hypothetical protein
VKQAYDDWINVVEYDGSALLKFKQKKKSVTTRSEAAKVSTSYPTSYGSAHSQKQLTGGPANVEQSSVSSTSEGIWIWALVTQHMVFCMFLAHPTFLPCFLSSTCYY